MTGVKLCVEEASVAEDAVVAGWEGVVKRAGWQDAEGWNGGCWQAKKTASQVDLIWGGGLRHFTPNTTSGSSRTDGRDLIAEAKQAGGDIVFNKTQITERSLTDWLKSYYCLKIHLIAVYFWTYSKCLKFSYYILITHANP